MTNYEMRKAEAIKELVRRMIILGPYKLDSGFAQHCRDIYNRLSYSAVLDLLVLTSNAQTQQEQTPQC